MGMVYKTGIIHEREDICITKIWQDVQPHKKSEKKLIVWYDFISIAVGKN